MMKQFLSLLFVNLVLSGEAFAQQAAQQAQQPSFGEVMFRMFPMFIIVFLIFHFMVIKPQQKKLTARQTLLDEIKKGDLVVTDGGLIGRVAGKEKDYILLEVSNNTKVKFEYSHIEKRFDPKKEAA